MMSVVEVGEEREKKNAKKQKHPLSYQAVLLQPLSQNVDDLGEALVRSDLVALLLEDRSVPRGAEPDDDFF